MSHPMNRRTFVITAIATAGTAALGRAGLSAAAEPVKLLESDATAKALGYTEHADKVDASKEAAYKKGSTCANCALYQTAQAKAGAAPCAAFPGKLVVAAGWCRVHADKPA